MRKRNGIVYVRSLSLENNRPNKISETCKKKEPFIKFMAISHFHFRYNACCLIFISISLIPLRLAPSKCFLNYSVVHYPRLDARGAK